MGQQYSDNSPCRVSEYSLDEAFDLEGGPGVAKLFICFKISQHFDKFSAAKSVAEICSKIMLCLSLY